MSPPFFRIALNSIECKGTAVSGLRSSHVAFQRGEEEVL